MKTAHSISSDESHCQAVMNPENFAPDFMAHFCEETMRIADRMIAAGRQKLEANPPAKPLKVRLSTGGGFGGFFLWDTSFCAMWAKYDPERFPVLNSLDNFYLMQSADGYICREYTWDGEACWGQYHPISFNPPLLAWAELELFDFGVSDLERLNRVYDSLKRHHDYAWATFRRSDGLFFGDTLGSGMDDLNRMPIGKEFSLAEGIPFRRDAVQALGEPMWNAIKEEKQYHWNSQMGWIDITSQMAFNAENIGKIAERIGKSDDAETLFAQHAQLKQLINEKCFDETLGFYCDHYKGETIPRYTIAGFWPLIAGVVPAERVKRLVTALNDPEIFGRPIPVPALAACEAEFDPENKYWRGASWPSTTYMVLRGLRRVGEESLARQLAKRYYNAIAQLYRKTGTVWENISCEQCLEVKKMAGPDFVGWGGLGPIAIYKEFLQQS